MIHSRLIRLSYTHNSLDCQHASAKKSKSHKCAVNLPHVPDVPSCLTGFQDEEFHYKSK